MVEGLDEFLKELGFEVSMIVPSESSATSPEEDSKAIETLASKLNLPIDEDQRNNKIYLLLNQKLQDPEIHPELLEKIQKLLSDFDELSDPPALGLQFCLLTELVRIHEKVVDSDKKLKKTQEGLKEKLEAVILEKPKEKK